MSLAQPTFPYFGGYINPEKDTEVSFSVRGGDAYTSSRLVIHDNITLELVGAVNGGTGTTFTIPANMCKPVLRDMQGNITQGNYYAYVATFDGDVRSPLSTRQVFLGYTEPVLTMQSIPNNTLKGFGYRFSATYSQDENMQLNAYHFELTDGVGADDSYILYSSPVRYSGLYQQPTTISEKIEGFENRQTYSIRVVGETVYGETITSAWYNFSVAYDSSYNYINAPQLSLRCADGCVHVAVSKASSLTSLPKPCYVKILRQEYPTYPLKQYTCVYKKKINSLSNLTFYFDDYTVADNTQYWYYLVVETQDGNFEAGAVMSNITTRLGGIWLCDRTKGFKLNIAPTFGETTSNIFTGVNSTFGQKYPVITANGSLNYQTGSLSFMPYNGDTSDRANITQQRNDFVYFVTHNRNKILRDWNGNYWLISITGSPSTAYAPNYGMGLVTISCSWTEIGNPLDPEDMKKAGLAVE